VKIDVVIMRQSVCWWHVMDCSGVWCDVWMWCCCSVDEADIIELEKQYWSLKGTSKSGRFDLETLTAVVSPPMPQELCHGLSLLNYCTLSLLTVCVHCCW